MKQALETNSSLREHILVQEMLDKSLFMKNILRLKPIEVSSELVSNIVIEPIQNVQITEVMDGSNKKKVKYPSIHDIDFNEIIKKYKLEERTVYYGDFLVVQTEVCPKIRLILEEELPENYLKTLREMLDDYVPKKRQTRVMSLIESILTSKDQMVQQEKVIYVQEIVKANLLADVKSIKRSILMDISALMKANPSELVRVKNLYNILRSQLPETNTTDLVISINDLMNGGIGDKNMQRKKLRLIRKILDKNIKVVNTRLLDLPVNLQYPENVY